MVWQTNATGGFCLIASPCQFAAFKAQYPAAAMIGLQAAIGTGVPATTSYVDGISLTIGGTTDTWDFELPAADASDAVIGSATVTATGADVVIDLTASALSVEPRVFTIEVEGQAPQTVTLDPGETTSITVSVPFGTTDISVLTQNVVVASATVTVTAAAPSAPASAAVATPPPTDTMATPARTGIRRRGRSSSSSAPSAWSRCSWHPTGGRARPLSSSPERGRLTGSRRRRPCPHVPTALRRPDSRSCAAVVCSLAACGSSAPMGPVLTDPTAIITAALTSTEAAKSVHVDVAVDGAVPVTLPGSTSATEVDLTGTTANADIDLKAGEMRATFSVPAVMGIAGELIQADGTTYLKTTLTGSKFKVVDGLTTFAVDPTDTERPHRQPRRLPAEAGRRSGQGRGRGLRRDAVLHGRRRPRCRRNWPRSSATARRGLPVDIDGASLKLTVRVEQTLPNHLAGVSIVLGLPSGETLNMELTFSKWDEGVTIEAPGRRRGRQYGG